MKNSSIHLLGAKHLGIAQFTFKEMTGVTQDDCIPILETDLLHGASQLTVVWVRGIWDDQPDSQSAPCA